MSSKAAARPTGADVDARLAPLRCVVQRPLLTVATLKHHPPLQDRAGSNASGQFKKLCGLWWLWVPDAPVAVPAHRCRGMSGRHPSPDTGHGPGHGQSPP